MFLTDWNLASLLLHIITLLSELNAALIKCFHCVCVWCSRTPLATFHEGKHNIAHMDMDPSRGLMVTCGSDRIVKVNNSSLIPDNSCMCSGCDKHRGLKRNSNENR